MLRKIMAGFIVLVVLALIVVSLWYRAEAAHILTKFTQAVVERDAALIENKQQAETIERLKAMDKHNNALLADISSQLAMIRADVMETGQSIKELETSDEAVHDFMSVPLPDDLRRLLNKK